MENLKLTRIDFRLVHGQVMTRWVKEYGIDYILVIDDRSASKPLLKKILIGAAPAGVKVEVESVQSAAQRWKAGNFTGKSQMILFKDPDTAAKAWEAGVKYPSLQIGGVEGSADAHNIYRNVVLTEEGLETLKKLDANGVEVFAQPIPDMAPFPFDKIVEKF